MTRLEEIKKQIADDPDAAAAMLLAWEEELSKVMPEDFKDWWQNSRCEWPLVARLVIEGLREARDDAF